VQPRCKIYVRVFVTKLQAPYTPYIPLSNILISSKIVRKNKSLHLLSSVGWNFVRSRSRPLIGISFRDIGGTARCSRIIIIDKESRSCRGRSERNDRPERCSFVHSSSLSLSLSPLSFSLLSRSAQQKCKWKKRSVSRRAGLCCTPSSPGPSFRSPPRRLASFADDSSSRPLVLVSPRRSPGHSPPVSQSLPLSSRDCTLTCNES